MVELQRAIFAPQNILASLIAAKSANPLAPGLFYAFINIFLSCLSGYSIGKSFGISRNLSLVLGFFIAINPIFLYQYAGPWWNAANGHTWSLVAIATFCLLRQSMTAWRVVANFLATLILLSSGWPHGIIGYFVIVGCISLVDLRYGEAFNLVVKRCLPLCWQALPLFQSIQNLLCCLVWLIVHPVGITPVTSWCPALPSYF